MGFQERIHFFGFGVGQHAHVDALIAPHAHDPFELFGALFTVAQADRTSHMVVHRIIDFIA